MIVSRESCSIYSEVDLAIIVFWEVHSETSLFQIQIYCDKSGLLI